MSTPLGDNQAGPRRRYFARVVLRRRPCLSAWAHRGPIVAEMLMPRQLEVILTEESYNPRDPTNWHSPCKIGQSLTLGVGSATERASREPAEIGKEKHSIYIHGDPWVAGVAHGVMTRWFVPASDWQGHRVLPYPYLPLPPAEILLSMPPPLSVWTLIGYRYLAR